ncbi:hypothetical protein [Mucilaginibacter dorajii]|uniref:Uncharacterized protein n=1 Tax=Mucilaginibacter dorajii TaxID=692994 RepID=A0ABP7PWK8_9SPHI|nr:hypothetical protein [Mucilaginibacter dorajii]MCS3737219.1 hypothetical protein [Mucilaginibacter dorajii]
MASNNVKKIGNHQPKVQPVQNTWEVMKPFVKFGLAATGLIAGTLITIIKNIPKPDNGKQPLLKKDKIIRI